MYQQYGFQSPRSILAATVQEAVHAAEEIGFPVALKVVSPDIVHKTDIGGVMLNLTSADQVRHAFDHILAAARAAFPQARLEGVEVQEMVTGGTEIIIGLLDDAQFGSVIMFGLGGVFTELLRDVSFRVLPIERDDARQMIREIQGYAVLQGYRGRPPVYEEMLIQLLMNAARMGEDLAGRLQSADFNPIVVWEDQHRVLDCKLIWHPEPRTKPQPVRPNTAHLDKFFTARSVALVGASATPGRVGNAVLDSLLNYDYRGKVYPINPTRSEIMGAKTYPTLQDAPDDIELVVAAVELRLVPEIIRTCAAKGIHNLVVVSGGGKELGGERAALESEVRQLARELDVRVVGPNCIGVFDGYTRLDTFFQVQQRMVRPRPGHIAMITQSGAVGIPFLELAADLGFSKFVSYGNRADVDEADLLTYLAEDPQTHLIAMYVEGFEDGRKFLEAARRVTRKKPVVIFKVGRTERAARASISHTGFFGGAYGVALGAFRQAGLVPVDSIEELLAVTKALAMQPRAQGNRVAMISNGAGTMVQGIDLLKPNGLEIPELSAESLARLRQAYPPYYIVQNPIDVTGSGTAADYEVGIETLLQDENIDIVMPWFVFQDTPLEEDIVQRLGRLNRRYDKPILVGTLGGPYTMRMSKALEAEGVPVFQGVRDWVAAARGVWLAGQRLAQ
ncbi:MAG: acyl-CoA synthetase [Ardenticatenia bacterium]|jgi:3-hydroxypropionyl-CoA synthetase (ADP-forming)|nr:MAG: acyl-CoA synthetase [Ardenticatenia bacterium]